VVVAEALAEGERGAPGERAVGVCLDLELDSHAGRGEPEQLIEDQRALVAGRAVCTAQSARANLGRRVLVCPARQRRARLEQRLMQQHQLAVGGQAAVRLEPGERALERPLERCGGGVWAVGTAEPVGVERREHPPASVAARALPRLPSCDRGVKGP
jgi:hypothetical protein